MENARRNDAAITIRPIRVSHANVTLQSLYFMKRESHRWSRTSIGDVPRIAPRPINGGLSPSDDEFDVVCSRLAHIT